MKVTVEQIVMTIRDCAYALLKPDLYLLADDIESNGIEGVIKLDAEQWDAFQESLNSRGEIDALIAEIKDVQVWCDGNDQFLSCSIDDVLRILDRYRGQKQ